MNNHDIREETDSGLLHNFGHVNPQLTVRITPFTNTEKGIGRGATPLSACGLRPVFQLNPESFIRHHLHTLGLGDVDLAQWWRNALILLAQVAVGRVSSPDTAALQRLGDNVEVLADEFISCTAELDPLAEGLPAFGMVDTRPNASLEIAPLSRGIAFLSRINGDLFVASHTPTLFAFTAQAPGNTTRVLLTPVFRKGDVS